MAILYMDTSAFIKRFKREKGSRGVRELFRIAEQPASDITLATSDWTINEALSAIRRWRLTEFELRSDAAKLLTEVGRWAAFRIALFR